MNRSAFVGALAVLGATACGAAARPVEIAPPPTLPVVAVAEFDAALDAFVRHDRANDWTATACHEVAAKFAEAGPSRPEALYDAGLAHERCGERAEAESRFQAALARDPKFHRARERLALSRYARDGNADAAIAALSQAVLDAQFQNVSALVNLAAIEMKRDAATGGLGCKDDMECAKVNLQRALAVDDANMAALNQFALYYLAQARKQAGSTASLELAALVCSQATRKDPTYAPIHNTAGLVQSALGRVNGAVAEFKTAATLDPRFFEAQMNYAQINLSFRGFSQAESAFKRAIAIRPNDYDAHLGLALALRGQIDGGNDDAQIAAVQSELDACKKIDAARPDAYYNEGILTQEYKAKLGGDAATTVAQLGVAIRTFEAFDAKARGKPEYDAAVKRANDRVQDAQDICTFLGSPSAGCAPLPTTPGVAPGAPIPVPGTPSR